MQVDLNKYPSFCKILDQDTCMDKLQMPAVFIKENKKMLAKTCILKTDVAGMVWKAKIARQKFGYFIRGGEWPKFVVHHKLEKGNTLIFFLIEKSTFQVKVYAQKIGLNLHPLEELSSSSSEDEKMPKKDNRKMPAKDTSKRPDASGSCYKTKSAKLSAKKPIKPKRPPTAFFVFLKGFRKKFANIKSTTPVDRAAGQKWTQLSDDEKAPFIAEAEERESEYRRKMAAYNRRLAASSEEGESETSRSDVDEDDRQRG